MINEYQLNVLQAFLALTIFGRLMYFMQIIDQVAPLINIILLIFTDIGWFVIVLAISIFAFANSFFIIAKNQMKYDNLDTESDNYPEYTTWEGAMVHVFRIALGDFEIGMYSDGDAGSYGVLMLLWVLSTFLLALHLLNMLIAIMGETFSANNETKDI